MNFILFILIAFGLKKVVEPLRQLSIMEVITLTRFIVSVPPHYHLQVGQAITDEATTLAPWAKLGRRASRQDHINQS